MLSPKLFEIYQAGLKDEEFNEVFEEADDDRAPGPLAAEHDKALYAAVYYGWLICKYGNSWKHHIKSEG